MILIILPNPALDKTVVLPGFTVGAIHRASEVLTLAGGKGFNVSRALRVLGAESHVLAPLGGYAGQRLQTLAAQDGLSCEGPVTSTEMRTCLTILDPLSGNRLTEIYEQGASLDLATWGKLVDLAVAYFARATFLVVCGSFPPGVPVQGLSDLLEKAHTACVPVVLDTHGPPLEAALGSGSDLLKINQHEAEEITGISITTPAQALNAAALLRARGPRQVVITLGKQGVAGLTASGEAFGWSAPKVEAISPVGSGDCLLAGIVAGLQNGQSLQEATRWGVAAGAANTLQVGAGRLEQEQVEQLIWNVQPLSLQ